MTPDPRSESAALRLAVIAVIVVVVIGGAFLAAKALGRWVEGLSEADVASIPPGLAVGVEVPAGSSAREIGELLAAEGVVGSAPAFEAAAREAGVTSELKAGTYRLTSGMDPASVVEILVVGPSVDTFWITIPEGLRLSEMLEHIASQSSLSVAELEGALTSDLVTSTLRPSGAPSDLASWEGLLFADTYQLARNWTAKDVLSLLAHTMEERYRVIEWSDPRLETLDAYQRLIAASVIEAETRVDSDRPLVAAVILNRLEAEMPLQIDATVLYGLGVRGRGPTLDELEVDTPYNTYLHTGLPPTPIGAPGTASLEALAGPSDADYLYYVRTGVDGSHSFTADYDEFLRWKQEAEAKGLG